MLSAANISCANKMVQRIISNDSDGLSKTKFSRSEGNAATALS